MNISQKAAQIISYLYSKIAQEKARVLVLEDQVRRNDEAVAAFEKAVLWEVGPDYLGMRCIEIVRGLVKRLGIQREFLVEGGRIITCLKHDHKQLRTVYDKARSTVEASLLGAHEYPNYVMRPWYEKAAAALAFLREQVWQLENERDKLRADLADSKYAVQVIESQREQLAEKDRELEALRLKPVPGLPYNGTCRLLMTPCGNELVLTLVQGRVSAVEANRIN